MSEVTDLVFPLKGQDMRPDYALPLWQALRGLLPWLADELDAGILPIKGGNHSDGRLILNQRAQLTLRLPQTRLAAAAALAGARLDLDAELQLGEPKLRALRPTPAQYSPMVVLDGANETEFLADCERQLAVLAIRANVVCGKAQACRAETAELRGYSLMLHGMSVEHALRLQQLGMGAGRKLGCGIFVPHRTAHAVGSA
ncbi:MAG: type I-MYXAN CRISPR-associated protein Cas6/Cmx6 [Proteobacteria bacterium]|nr:type I-MYXAN CRISPR-associated protein Cas6/Cmx6 [Pseudomonadota bacterium]